MSDLPVFTRMISNVSEINSVHPSKIGNCSRNLWKKSSGQLKAVIPPSMAKSGISYSLERRKTLPNSVPNACLAVRVMQCLPKSTMIIVGMREKSYIY